MPFVVLTFALSCLLEAGHCRQINRAKMNLHAVFRWAMVLLVGFMGGRVSTLPWKEALLITGIHEDSQPRDEQVVDTSTAALRSSSKVWCR